VPWTLYRYILRELLAILLLSTAVIVTVLSFFVAIKPLSDGYLDAVSLVKFVIYTVPTVLAFALPFAGAFASTVVFLRLAADNEITACAASGISYFRVLLPVIGLGIVLMAVLLYMSNFVIPGYYKKATKTAQADALTMIESRLNQGLPVTFGEYVLYAESAQTVSADQIDTADYVFPPSKLIRLERVVFGQADAQGKMRWDYTAGRAAAMLFRRDERSWLTIRLRDSVFYDPTLGRMQEAEVDPLDLGPIEPPNPFEDEPRFMSYPDLRALDRHPQRYGRVAKAMRALTIALGQETLRQAFDTRVSAAGVELIGPIEGETFVIEAPSAQRVGPDTRLSGAAGRPVRITHDRRGQRVWTIEADVAMVRYVAGEFDDEPAVLVELVDAKVFDPGPDRAYTEHPVLSLPRMRWSGPLLPIESGTDATPRYQQLRALAGSAAYGSNEQVQTQSEALRLAIARLAYEIIAQKHLRAATAICGFLLLVLGAVLSIHLRHQMTLVVFFWSFLLAIVALVLIHSGSKAVADQNMAPAPGLALLWSGNVVLALVAGWVYCRFARN